MRAQWQAQDKEQVGRTEVSQGAMRAQWQAQDKEQVGRTEVSQGAMRSQWQAQDKEQVGMKPQAEHMLWIKSSGTFLVKLLSNKCHRTLLMISQQWFRTLGNIFVPSGNKPSPGSALFKIIDTLLDPQATVG